MRFTLLGVNRRQPDVHALRTGLKPVCVEQRTTVVAWISVRISDPAFHKMLSPVGGTSSTRDTGTVESLAEGWALPLAQARAVLIINSFGCWASAR